jgi:hypothetical protein
MSKESSIFFALLPVLFYSNAGTHKSIQNYFSQLFRVHFLIKNFKLSNSSIMYNNYPIILSVPYSSFNLILNINILWYICGVFYIKSTALRLYFFTGP